MGCSCVKIPKAKEAPIEVDDVNNRRLQKVSVVVGPSIRKVSEENDDKPLILFVFGGPGSFKGRVVDDLIQAYGFTYLNAEDLILEQLPKRLRLASSMDKIMDLLQFLNDDDSCLSLDWLFEILSNQIDRKPNGSYLVDIITNLRVFLRSEALNKGHATCLQKFEEKYPVLFAVNLAIPKDKILQTVASHYAHNTGKNLPPEELAKEGARQSDEMDLSKTHKRANLYETNARPYLDYFSNRLISVDVSCAMADSISFKICDLCREQGIAPVTAPKSSILFSFSDNTFPGLDLTLYGLQKIVLANNITNHNMSLEELLGLMCGEIKQRLCLCRSLYVDLHGTCILKESLENIPSKGVSFVEVLEGPLDHFIPVDIRTDDRKLYTDDFFKAIVSPEGDMCIFHSSVDTNVCVKLARFVADSRSHKHSTNHDSSSRSVQLSIEVVPLNPVDS